MPASAVSVCNQALSYLGAQNTIQAIGEASAEGRACQTHYDQAVEEVLREHAWPFATRRVPLALVMADDGNQTWSGEWGYAYRYPSDALRILNIVTGVKNDPAPPAFELGDDDQGTLVYTDQADAVVRYTCRAVSPSKWSADFIEALAWKLATKLAMPLAVKTELRAASDQTYQEKIARAKLGALNEAQRAPEPDAEWVREKDG